MTAKKLSPGILSIRAALKTNIRYAQPNRDNSTTTDATGATVTVPTREDILFAGLVSVSPEDAAE